MLFRPYGEYLLRSKTGAVKSSMKLELHFWREIKRLHWLVCATCCRSPATFLCSAICSHCAQISKCVGTYFAAVGYGSSLKEWMIRFHGVATHNLADER